MSTQPARTDPYKLVTDTILAHLERGVIPWRCPWKRTVGHPRNFHSGHAYQGVNALLLGLMEFPSPWWMTFRQVNEREGQVRKGEHGAPVMKWGRYEKKQKNGDGTEEKKTTYYLRTYRVFNAVQIEGIEFPPVESGPELDPKQRIAAAEQIVEKMPQPPKIKEGRTTQASYRPRTDTIQMPSFKRFDAPEDFHLVLFHELIHSTGHESRLARKEVMESDGFGGKIYSQEELVAEMGAAFLGMEAGKAAVSMLQVLERYGIAEKFKRSGDSLSGPCPLHDGQNPTQFRVSIGKNCWHCFGRCNDGGNVLEFVARKESVTLREAALILSDWFQLPDGEKSTAQEEPIRPKPKQPANAAKAKADAPSPDENAPNKPLGFALRNLDVAHSYFAERGLSEATIAEFGLGFCGKGSMTGRIVIPIHNGDGQLVAYAGRLPGTPPDEELPKYKLPPGFRKAQELFNSHRAFREPDEAPLVIVEGFFDCLALWQQGIRRVVALMGSALSLQQEAMIAAGVSEQSRIIIILDEDDAGREARKKITPRLAEHCFVHSFRFENEGQQPDSLNAEQIERLKR